MTRRFATLALLLLASACPSSAPHPDTGPPPPRGQSYAEYLGRRRERAFWPTRPADTNDADRMVLHFIDVGQGTSILLEFPCGAVLVDTGGEENPEFDSRRALFAYLDAFFARRRDLRRTLDLLVITHPHIDHDRWVLDVLDSFTVRNVIDDGLAEGAEPGAPEMAAMHAWLARHSRTVKHQDILASQIPSDGLTSGVIDPVGGCAASATDPVIRALWGQVTEDRDTYGDNPNLHSVVLRVDFGHSSALLEADLETLGAARMTQHFASNLPILDVDIYQVGHHGSRNGTVAHLMKHMTPKLAVIPVGPYGRDEDWTARRYGHPNREAIDLLTDRHDGVAWDREDPIEVPIGVRGAWKEKKEQFERRRITKAIFATGWDGTVRVLANANGWIDVQTERGGDQASQR